MNIGARLTPQEREQAILRKRAREREDRSKPRAAPPTFTPPRHAPWFGRCPAFRPRTEADANRETRL